MSKYKGSRGFAIAPQKDMRMLEKMSRKGWHIAGMSGLFYRLEKGESHEYIYDYNMEEEIEKGMLSLYESSGWELVYSQNGFQIFRAEKGTTPLFTDSESKVEVLEKQRKAFAIPALVFTLLFFISAYVMVTQGGTVSLVLTACLYCGSVFTVFPFFGLCNGIRKAKKEKKN
ncbi:MAG: DUF2812 domain-containing protein [Lachnospiraceae bacterium]|nr:DUF2812 domain-containing protein [Lachnospiraceae bacterium]